MKINYVIILITTYLSFLFSDINATTEDGEKIILFIRMNTIDFQRSLKIVFNMVELALRK